LGFDCEDLLAENGTDPVDIIECIQSEYLPLCDYVSAPSKCVGRRLTEKYRIDSPLILYNVSPTYLAAGMTSPVARAERPTVRLYWSGQTIGEGRGIEEAITALGIMATEPVELHLRGRLGSDFRSRIEGLARDAGVLDKLFIHGIVPPQDFIRTMAQFDVGLALERADHGNYSLTATNKLFGYLLAGLAVAATDTSGHRELMEQIPAAGFLYQAGNPAALAVGLRRWISERDSLCATKRAAWDAARIHFCWDIEKEKLFQLLESPRSNRLNQTA